jgi:hypothetical protein
MADREQPYDPYIPAAGAGAQQGAQGQNGNHRTAALQAVCLPSFPVDIAPSQRLLQGRSAVVVQRRPRAVHRRCPSEDTLHPRALPGALRSAATPCRCNRSPYRIRRLFY